jgi:DNA-binding transcriptional LysR family regulator
METFPSRINLNLLRSFASVARHCSFVRAAGELGRSQATLSAQVRELEEQLGVRLLDRTTRRVSLTSAGELLAKQLDKGLREIAEGLAAARELSSDRRGRLVIACVPSLSGSRFPPILAAYRRRDNATRIDVEELTSAEVVTALLEGKVDMGVGPYASPLPAGIGVLPAAEEPLCVVIPKALDMQSEGTMTLKLLSTLPLITLSGSVLLQTVLEKMMEDEGLRLSSQTEVRHVQTAVAMVRAGVGAAVVPRLALPDELDPDILILSVGTPPLSRPLGILTQRGRPLSPVAMRFARHVRSALVKALQMVSSPNGPVHP